MIVVIDYGMGNVGSILNMLKFLGAQAVASREVSDLESASRLILPGVGSFDEGVKRLRELDLIPKLHELALDKKVPTLGVCLGMQLMTMSSEEGKEAGLGWFQARTVGFEQSNRRRIPHIGWNRATFETGNAFPQEQTSDRFYFLHSYHVDIHSVAPGELFAKTEYEGCSFASGLCRDNLVGVQFHPEKSHRCGKSFFRKFLEYA